jgi:prepilin-type N-terminal cleavage/methylation domain-containing protein
MYTARGKGAGRRSGFTILELLLSLGAISIIACIAVPAWFERSEVTLDNACRLLARDLRLAQNRAAVTGEHTSLEFLVDGTGYRVVADELLLEHPRTGLPFRRSYPADAVFEGVDVSEVELTNGGRRITFTPTGKAFGGGSVTLGFMGDERRVFVEETSGYVTIEDSGWRDDGL